MRIILLLLLHLPLLFASLSNNNNNDTLKELSAKAFENLFQKYSNSTDTVHFENFLEKFNQTFIQAHDHHHDHTKQKNQTECIDKTIEQLKKLSGQQIRLEAESFGQLSTIFVTNIDSCIPDLPLLNKTLTKDMISMKKSKF